MAHKIIDPILTAQPWHGLYVRPQAQWFIGIVSPDSECYPNAYGIRKVKSEAIAARYCRMANRNSTDYIYCFWSEVIEN